MTTIKTNPHRAVDYSEYGIKKALEAAGSLEAEVKYDGVRLNLTVLRGGETYWLSRESKPLPALEWMNSELGNAWTQADWRWFLRQAGYEGVGLMIDGEVMIKGVEYYPPGRGKKLPFWGARSRLQVVVYGVVDMTTISDPKAEGPIHSVTRLKAEAIVPLLQKYFPEIDWVLSESHTVYDLESLNSLYEQKRLEGHEGLVVKDPLGKYKRGKKSGMWKMKPEETIDGTVCGLVWGTTGKANEGKVIGFEVLLEDGMVVNACGLTEEQKDEFTGSVFTWTGYETQSRYQSERCDAGPYEGWQCEVLFMERFPDGSLRHPSFKCWRGTEDNPTVKS